MTPPPTDPAGKEPAPPSPREVSRFEANLLRVLRFFLRQWPAEQALPLLSQRHTPPACLGAACVELVQDSLSKGCVLYLARAGGWRRDGFLRSGRPVVGRLWERTPPDDLGLTFSGHALSFLVWLTATGGKAGEGKADWSPPEKELTPADRLLLFLAYDALRETEHGVLLRARSAISRHGLCRLAFPEDFAGTASTEPADVATWVDGLGACILEALHPVLAARWLQLERGKNQIGDWAKMRGLGQSQDRVLEAFLPAADAAGRPDLARFLLKAMAELLVPGLAPSFWIGGLQGSGPPRLAERLDVQRAALAPLRVMERLQQWERRARMVGYFDEGYAASQFWKSDWERWRGDELTTRAQGVLRQLEPLKVQA